MKRARILRLLRISASLTCLLLCAAFVVLWVRTADNGTNFQEPLLQVSDLAVYSTDGIIWAVKAAFVEYSPPTGRIVSFYIPPRYQATPEGFANTAIHKGRGFDLQFSSRRCWFVQVPNWFPIAVAVALTAAPWIRYRFSLRTLLIATTLVAVLLGVVVYAAGK